MNKKVVSIVAAVAVAGILGLAGVNYYIDSKVQEVKETGEKVVKVVTAGTEKVTETIVEVKTDTLVTAKQLSKELNTTLHSADVNKTKEDLNATKEALKSKLSAWLKK